MTLGNDNGTDGQTDRRTDGQSATHREEGRIIIQPAIIAIMLEWPWPMWVVVLTCEQFYSFESADHLG